MPYLIDFTTLLNLLNSITGMGNYKDMFKTFQKFFHGRMFAFWETGTLNFDAA